MASGSLASGIQTGNQISNINQIRENKTAIAKDYARDRRANLGQWKGDVNTIIANAKLVSPDKMQYYSQALQGTNQLGHQINTSLLDAEMKIRDSMPSKVKSPYATILTNIISGGAHDAAMMHSADANYKSYKDQQAYNKALMKDSAEFHKTLSTLLSTSLSGNKTGGITPENEADKTLTDNAVKAPQLWNSLYNFKYNPYLDRR